MTDDDFSPLSPPQSHLSQFSVRKREAITMSCSETSEVNDCVNRHICGGGEKRVFSLLTRLSMKDGNALRTSSLNNILSCSNQLQLSPPRPSIDVYQAIKVEFITLFDKSLLLKRRLENFPLNPTKSCLLVKYLWLCKRVYSCSLPLSFFLLRC